MLGRRAVAGLMGADAHQRAAVTRKMAVPFPSYASVFRLARNHVLLDRPLSGDAEADGRAVVEALARGRSYVGVDALAAGGWDLLRGRGRRAALDDGRHPRATRGAAAPRERPDAPRARAWSS